MIQRHDSLYFGIDVINWILIFLFFSASHYSEPVNAAIDCSEIFQIFHKCTGRFLEVALDTANPFTLCTNKQAYGLYRNLTFFFKLLEENHDKKTNIVCSEEYLNKNQMGVISHIVSTSKGIYEKIIFSYFWNVFRKASLLCQIEMLKSDSISLNQSVDTRVTPKLINEPI